MTVSSLISTALSYFPGCIYWSRFRAFFGAMTFALGIVTGSGLTKMPPVTPGTLYLFFILGATTAVIIAVFSRKLYGTLVALFAAGILVTLQHGARENRYNVELERLQNQKMVITGEICSPPAPRRDRFVWLLRIREVAGRPETCLRGATFMCTGTDLPDAAGSVTFEGHLSSGRVARNRYDFNERAFFRANGVVGRITVERLLDSLPPQLYRTKITAWFRERVVAVIKTYTNPDHRAVIRASFLNEKSYLAPEIKNAFRASGLYHLLSLSGLHAGILLAAVYLLLGLFPVPARARHLTALTVVWLYYLYIGAVPSLARATVMATVVIASLLLQRKNYPLQSLGIAALVWLWWSPASLGQAGFQFSFLATFGILTIHPLIMKSYSGHSHPVLDYGIRLLLTPFSVSLAAFCATLPAMAWHFGTISMFGFIANIVGVTLMTGGMWLFFIGLLFAPFVPIVSQGAILGSSLFLGGLLALANIALSVPMSVVDIPAPYPELIALFYLLLIAVVTVLPSARKKVFVWLLPIACCCIPGDYLARRVMTGVQVIRFDTASAGTEVTAVRQPDGSTTLFCNGSDGAVSSLIRYSVTPWARHVPGTDISSIYTAVPEGTSGSGDAHNGSIRFDGMLLHVVPGGENGAPPCSCRYDATGGRPVLKVRYGTTKVRCRGKGVAWHSASDSTAGYGRAEAPVAIELKKNRCRVLPMD